MELRIKIPIPDDPAKRALLIAIVASILLHIALLASLLTVNRFATPDYRKRGEPLFVDITPDKPEEKAPTGNPSRPVAPPEPAPRAPEPPAARPKIAEAPPAPKVAPAPRAPEPPKQVAKAEPPPPPPKAPEPPAPSPDAVAKTPEPAAP